MELNPTTQREADERALFEATFKLDQFQKRPHVTIDGDYQDSATQCAWTGWQLGRAAIAHSEAPAPALPTNDEVYAEVQRLRDEHHRYVSTNAVNDTMQAVRSLLASPVAAPEAAATEQQAECVECHLPKRANWDACYECGGKEFAPPAATTAIASGARIDATGAFTFPVDDRAPAQQAERMQPSREAAPVGSELREITRAVVAHLGWSINGTWVITKSGDQLHTADAIALVHAALTRAPLPAQTDGQGGAA